LTIVDRWCRIVVKGEGFMIYYDDRDYYNSENIDELYDHNDSQEVNEDPTWVTSWEYNYHDLTEELIDD
jgi:hypothetical protein